MRVLRLVIIGAVLTGFAMAQGALTKDQIVDMSKAGLPEDVIIAKIKAEPLPLKLAASDLVALKASGVSDGVIRALMGVGDSPASAAAAATPAAAAADPDDPMSPHDPGLYLATTTRDGKKKRNESNTTLILRKKGGSWIIETEQ